MNDNDELTLDMFGSEENKTAQQEPEPEQAGEAEAVEAVALPEVSADSSGGDEPPQGGDDGSGEGDEPLPELAQFAERAYLEYAMSVVKGRALPDVADGQKPVQRRILFAMHDMGLTSAAKPVKSARVVGEILGKYHPHGDSSAYEALVRLAQDFTMRYPLIDGQGNFGSRDGDGAAAMRYTEARLTPLAELLLGELNEGTVDFVPNYDGAFDEPALLPARLPMVLLNGASGIAVGMATEIPPHNLKETAAAAIALLQNPDASVADLLQHMPGPDFPGGGQIISSAADIQAAYETGRGSLRLRARWQVEELARGYWRLVVNELPHGVSAQRVLSEIEDASNPKIKPGKKALTQEQNQLKQLILSVLDKVRDESGQQAPVRLVFEPRSSRMNPQDLINVLLTHTSLEVNTPINLVMLGRDGRPQQKNLRQIVAEWLDFRWQAVTRRTQHRLGVAEKRIHILEGRRIAFLHIEEIIRVIRESDEPKSELMAAFGLSEIQAEDILEIRLRQLARLEGIRIEKELGELQETAAGLRHLLDNRDAMQAAIIAEIERDAARFGDNRRTLIETAERVSASRQVADEPITLILSKKGWLRSRSGHGVEAQSLTFKDGDSLLALVETRTVHPAILLDHTGRAYSLLAADVPGGRGDGVPVSTFIDAPGNTRIVAMLSAPAETAYLVANSGGYGFVAKLSDMQSRIKAGKTFMTLEDNETVLPPVALGDAGNAVALSATGRLLVFPVAEIKQLAKGRGVQLIKLEDADSLALLGVCKDKLTLAGQGRGGKDDQWVLGEIQLMDYRSSRAKKGKPVLKPLKNMRII